MFPPRIGFFWDVDECPFPEGAGPRSVYKFLKSALKDEDYLICSTYLRIFAYDEKKVLPWADLPAPMTLKTRIGEEWFDKYERMVIDIMFWAMHNEAPSCVIVVSKSISEHKGLVSVLKSLQLRNYNIAFAHSLLPTPTQSVWLLREGLPAEVEVRPIFQSRKNTKRKPSSLPA